MVYMWLDTAKPGSDIAGCERLPYGTVLGDALAEEGIVDCVLAAAGGWGGEGAGGVWFG